MKPLILFLFLFFSSFYGFNQKKKEKKAPIIELQFSLNRTMLFDDNTINGNGFGVGLNIVDSKKRILNFVFGVDINATHQIKKEFYAPRGKVGNSTLYNEGVGILGISFSALGRYHFGNKRNLFIEQGVFIGLPIDIGLLGGFGIIIPVKKLEFVIKPSYVYGIGDLNTSVNGIGRPTPVFNQFVKLSIGIRLLDFFKG